MRAMRLHEIGALLSLDEVPVPVPGPGEVLVQVHACGVNFADTLMVTGRYQEKPSLPFAPGMELCGTIQSGEGFAHGTRIAAFGGSGGFAEYAVIPVNRCVPVPESMSHAQAAAFLIAYGTSHVALEHRARLKAGETLLVLGAAGGVGLTAVELGKLMGAKVIACARGADKLVTARAAGADHLIDSTTADLRAEVKALGGADVVYDPVGGDLFTQALRATNPGGRILPLGFASGEVPQIPANILLVKNISVLGLYWGGYATLDPKVLTDSLTELLGWFEQGKLSPHISHQIPLEDANHALDLLRDRASTGKVVVVID